MSRALPIVVVIALVACGLGYATGGVTLMGAAIAALAIQWCAFVPAYQLQTERFYDLTGSLTYLTLTVALVAQLNAWTPRGVFLAGCTVIWAVRLGTFLAVRVHKAGHDSRFAEIKPSAPRFLVAWTLQGLWVFLTALPVWVVLADPKPGFGLVDLLGLGLWIGGFAIEVTADSQKTQFRADPANQGRFIHTGLWAWSRHPNYFGEIVLWTGLFLVSANQLMGLQWLAALSPVFVTSLLLGVSGVPLLEAQAEVRWGDDPDYQAYRDRTPVLIPLPPR